MDDLNHPMPFGGSVDLLLICVSVNRPSHLCKFGQNGALAWEEECWFADWRSVVPFVRRTVGKITNPKMPPKAKSWVCKCMHEELLYHFYYDLKHHY